MKIYRIILTLFASVLVLSCDVNDLEPYDAISEELAYTTPERIALSLAGVYDAAQSGFYADASNEENNDRGYIFGAAHVQQGDMRGEDMLLINTFYGLTYQSTIDATTPNNSYYWHNGFRLINLANLFIEGIEGAVEEGVIDEATKISYEGEARLLRALAYHELLIHFARPFRDGNGSALGLPIRRVGVNSPQAVEEQLEVGRASVAEVYDFIIEDLDFAEQNLSDNPVTRASKGAAVALKTRVYLHKGQWDMVITEGNKMVPASGPFKSPLGGYELTESVEGPWALNANNSESIFSMGMSENDNLNVNAALGNMYASSAINGRGEVAISPILWNQPFWHEDDLRRSEEMVLEGASGRLFTNKYRDPATMTDFSPIIRYAEVLLNVAEAEARTGGFDRALELLNAVRDRAIAGAMSSYSSGSFGNDNELVQAILNERRIEFLAEGMRWKDIHRNGTDPNFSTNGVPAKMISSDVDGSTYEIGQLSLPKGVSAVPYADYRFVWPIPATEVSANPTLAKEQNPGY